MSVNENKVYIASKLYVNTSYPEASPEKVIYGYLKLLLMEKPSLKEVLTEDGIKELEEVRQYVSDKNLVLQLVLTSLTSFEEFVEEFKDDKIRKRYDRFAKYLEDGTSETASIEIFTHAVETTVIPICEICTKENSVETITEYIDSHKQKKRSDPHTKKQKMKKTTEQADTTVEYTNCDFDPSIRDDVKGFVSRSFDDPYIGFRELDLISYLIEYLLDFCGQDKWTWDNVTELLGKVIKRPDPEDDPELAELFRKASRQADKQYIEEFFSTIWELDHFYLKKCVNRAIHMINAHKAPADDIVQNSNLDPLIKECRRFLEEWSVDRIVAYLSRTIVGQEEAKEKVAELCFEHVFRIAYPEYHFKKSCYVMFGPTGSGKTEMIRQIDAILPVPVMMEDASLITSEGFKGKNITDFMKQIMRESSETSTWNYAGIIAFDEFDKICVPRHDSKGADVNKEIQGQFLKIMEGESSTYDTEDITFICVGSFDGAFSDYGKAKGKKQFQSNINKGISECLIEYGMIPEIAGRINTIIPLEKLGIDAYKKMLNLETGKFNDIKAFFKKAYNVDIRLSDEAIDRLCVLAAVNNLGARGLETIIRVVFSKYRQEAKEHTLHITAKQVDDAYFGITSDKSKYSRDGGRNMVLIQQNNNLTLDSVAGLEEEKEELREIIDFLKNPDKYTEAGARLPKGILFSGPPGTGKTMLAKAIAGEANVPFYSLSGSDLIGYTVSEGVEKVKDLFRQAKSNAPAILFIDEIDAIAGSRETASYNTGVLNQILVEMDGFNSNSGLMVIAATNMKEKLDDAIKRAGRFDRKVQIRMPDVTEREAILKIHAENKRLSRQVNLHDIAAMTIGFSGAELESLLNEAAIDSAKANHRCIRNEDIHEEFIRMCFGTEKKHRQIPDKEKNCIAYHEAGHAIMLHLLPQMQDPHIISIIPTGDAAGYVYRAPVEGMNTMTKDYMLAEIKVSLAGRIAEELYSGDITAGAYSDIRKATDIAKEMVTVYGMSRELGPISFEKGFSESTGQSIDNEVSSIVHGCYEDAKKRIEENKTVLEKCVELLLKKERITGKELVALFPKEQKGKKS